MQVWFKTFQKCLDFELWALSQFTGKKNDVKWRGRRKTASYWWKVDIAQLNQCISPEIPVWLFLDRTHRDLLVLSSLQSLPAAGASAHSAAGTLLVDLCTKSALNLACIEKVKWQEGFVPCSYFGECTNQYKIKRGGFSCFCSRDNFTVCKYGRCTHLWSFFL